MDETMSAAHQLDFSDRMPSDIDRQAANRLRSIIADLTKDDEPTELKLVLKKGVYADVVLTPALAHTLLDLLRLVGSGQGFQMIPVEAELTTQQTADLLNVSRPHLIGLLNDQKIPFHKVGRHRRIRAEDAFAYRNKRDGERAAILAAMAEEDARLGLI
ncbi:helix-turn-helix domain-containing protein [Maricaulis sp.]|uniref:helix-turn-helix domain-containing protein n=1 Tax=Maricaulis sp. TaxID=1486257 RepID=UPI003A8D305E